MIKSTFRSMSLPAGVVGKNHLLCWGFLAAHFFLEFSRRQIDKHTLRLFTVTWNISFYGWFNYWNILKGWFSILSIAMPKLSDGTNRVVSDFDEIFMVCLRDFMGNERDYLYNEGDYLNQLITGGWPHCWKQQEINPCINPWKWGKTFVYLLELVVSCRVSFYQVFVQLWKQQNGVHQKNWV